MSLRGSDCVRMLIRATKRGLIAIEQAGGLAIVQDPGDARDPGMPMSALLDDNPDLCLPLSEIPGVIIRLSSVSQGST